MKLFFKFLIIKLEKFEKKEFDNYKSTKSVKVAESI